MWYTVYIRIVRFFLCNGLVIKERYWAVIGILG